MKAQKQYVVPLFQRPYSWEKKEWDVLWEDLVWLCQNEEPKGHFIGSIATIPTVSVSEGVSKFLLIDGQQRLATIFILLTLLRDVAIASFVQSEPVLVNQWEFCTGMCNPNGN